MRHYSGSLTAAVIFAIALAIIITLIGTWLAVELAFGADAAQPCLTKAQARPSGRGSGYIGTPPSAAGITLIQGGLLAARPCVIL